MKNFGIIREGIGKAVLRPIPIPKLPDDCILVRTVAIALNPTDWMKINAKGKDGILVGCDYSGTVEEVGKAVTKPFKKGDRIAGLAHGGNDVNPESGAFARLIVVKGDLQLHIPDNISFEAAATVGVGIGTVGYGLYKTLKIPLPDAEVLSQGKAILIYGGSTASGTLAIQFARMSGCKVITTCSPKHFELMRDRGAHSVYDYHDPGVSDKIHSETEGTLTNVFDTVSIEATAAICAKAIGSDGGNYCNLLGMGCPRTDVQSVSFLGYSLFGEPYTLDGNIYPAQPEDFAFGSKFYSIADKLWADGKWKPHPQRVGSGGLLGAVDGLEQMRDGKGPSGEKWVYLVDDTEWPQTDFS
ncbi:MAG: putative secondary metabolism biosynthetic enzyme [Bathelium mastoideum]|nr:MAG: putative secondary metabolism biosynthetic enzyme [Bathelium mastoideum]